MSKQQPQTTRASSTHAIRSPKEPIASIDASLCVACGFCVQNCPAVFSVEQSHHIKGGPIPPNALEDATDAMMLCPAGAIAIHEKCQGLP